MIAIEAVLQLILDAVVALLLGLFFMLAVGVAHHEWWPAVPTIGYWWSVLLLALLRAAFTDVRARTDKS